MLTAVSAVLITMQQQGDVPAAGTPAGRAFRTALGMRGNVSSFSDQFEEETAVCEDMEARLAMLEKILNSADKPNGASSSSSSSSSSSEAMGAGGGSEAEASEPLVLIECQVSELTKAIKDFDAEVSERAPW